MTTKEVELTGGAPWGFRMHGGVDQNQPLRISRVNPGRKASLSGIREGDVISSINGQSTKGMSNSDAHAMLRSAGPVLRLGLNEDRETSPRRRSIGKASELKRPSQIIAEVNSGRATPQPPVYATIRPSQSPHNRTFSSPMRSLNSVQTTLSSTPLVKSIASTEEPLKFHPTNPFYTTLPSNYSSASKLPVPNGRASLAGVDRNKSINKSKDSTSLEDYTSEQPPVYSTTYDPSLNSTIYKDTQNKEYDYAKSKCNTSCDKKNDSYSEDTKPKYSNAGSVPNDVTQNGKNPFETKRNSDPFEKYLHPENKMNGTLEYDSKKIFNSKSDSDFHSREEVTKHSSITEHKISEIEEIKTIKKIVLNGLCDKEHENIVNDKLAPGSTTSSHIYRTSQYQESPKREHNIKIDLSPNQRGMSTPPETRSNYFDTLDGKDHNRQRFSTSSAHHSLRDDYNDFTPVGEAQPSEVVVTKPPARSPSAPASKLKMEGKENTPETSKLKSKNRKYSEAVLKSAIESVLESRLTVYGASKEYNVPWSTLKVNVERVKQERELGETQIKMLKVGRPFSLSINLEHSLLSYIVQMQEIGFGLTVNQIRQLAFTLADNSDSKHYFNANKGHAGWNWWVGFKERYGLSLRSPENLSSGRAICSNATVLADFYEKLQTTLASHDLTDCPERIWNCDETGLMYVNKPNKIVTKIGKKYVYNRTYAEKGTTTTVLACINAAGQFLPPLVIFKGVRNIPELCRGAFPNSLTRLSPKGWINADLFYEWLQFFNDNIPPARPVLLIMDSHASHITPQVLAYAKSHQVILFTMPAHTSHLLQPLDVGIFKSLKTVWRAELQDYKVKNPSKVPTRLDFHTFLTPVYEKCFTPSNIRSGFRKTGIFPLNKKAICPEAIAPSTLSDKVQVMPEVVSLQADYDIEIAQSEIHNTDIDPFKETEIAEISPQEIESAIPCTSFNNQPHPIGVAPSEILQMECESEQITETNNLASASSSNLKKILIHDILVLPKWKPNKTRQKRTVPKAQCLTPIVSTSSTDPSDAKLTDTKITNTKLTITKEKSLSHQKNVSGSRKRNVKSIVKQTSTISKPLKTSSTDDDWFCSVCNGWYSHDVKMKNGADWITCSFCIHPYHTHCQSQDVNDDQRVFMCDNCSFDNSSGEE